MNTGLSKDPYLGIEVYDWLELWCAFLGGNYRVFVFEQEPKKVEGRKVQGSRKMHLMGPPYFDFYDSFNAPIAHAQTNNVRAFEKTYERFIREYGAVKGRLKLLEWFFCKHSQQILTRGLMVIGIIILLYGFMTGWATTTMMNAVMKATTAAAPRPISTKAPEAVAQAATAPASGSSATPTGGAPSAAETAQAAQVKMLNDQLSEQMKRSAELEATIAKATAIALMTETTVTMRGGYTYAIGDEIDVGPYKGKKIVSMNWPRRSVKLDDETILSLGY